MCVCVCVLAFHFLACSFFFFHPTLPTAPVVPKLILEADRFNDASNYTPSLVGGLCVCACVHSMSCDCGC